MRERKLDAISGSGEGEAKDGICGGKEAAAPATELPVVVVATAEVASEHERRVSYGIGE